LYTLCCFLQAEDGIRVLHVTGVQTCALPIYGQLGRVRDEVLTRDQRGTVRHARAPCQPVTGTELVCRPSQQRSMGPWPGSRIAEIGRASCRDRVYNCVVTDTCKRETRKHSAA